MLIFFSDFTTVKWCIIGTSSMLKWINWKSWSTSSLLEYSFPYQNENTPTYGLTVNLPWFMSSTSAVKAMSLDGWEGYYGLSDHTRKFFLSFSIFSPSRWLSLYDRLLMLCPLALVRIYKKLFTPDTSLPVGLCIKYKWSPIKNLCNRDIVCGIPIFGHLVGM